MNTLIEQNQEMIDSIDTINSQLYQYGISKYFSEEYEDAFKDSDGPQWCSVNKANNIEQWLNSAIDQPYL